MPPLGPIKLINHGIDMVTIGLKWTKTTLIFEKKFFPQTLDLQSQRIILLVKDFTSLRKYLVSFDNETVSAGLRQL